MSGATKLEEVADEQVILFVKNVPDWKHKMPCLMDVTVEIREMGRNKRGRVLHAIECHGIQDMEVEETDDMINHHLKTNLRNENLLVLL